MTTKTKNFTIEIEGNNVKVTNKFGDTYKGTLDENGKAITKTAIGLGYITKALDELKELNV